MKIIIKNMVCRHCIETVKRVLSNDLGFPTVKVELGMAEIEDCDENMMFKVEKALENEGFEVIKSREAQIVDDIKRVLINLSYEDAGGKFSLASYLSENLSLSYVSLSRLFSEIEGRSIENYFLNLRIERVKELIKYQQLSLSEIAYQLGFSSVSHLSRQFKQLTGLTPTRFKEIGHRKPLPEI